MKDKVIIFDLDDTLYKELDYLKSAYKTIVVDVKKEFNVELNFEELFSMYLNGDNVFNHILKSYPTSGIQIEYLLNIYRYHIPIIKLESSTLDKLVELNQKYSIGIITDGRSITQRNKTAILGLDKIVDEIIISEEFGSEKPNINNYLHFQNKYPNCEYYYIGDNVRKDFVSPNKLGWTTIGIKDTNDINIHTQKIDVQSNYLPNIWVDDISNIEV